MQELKEGRGYPALVYTELRWIPNLPLPPVRPRPRFLNLHKPQSPHLKPENNSRSHYTMTVTIPLSGSFYDDYKASIVSQILSPSFSHKTSWKIIYDLYLFLVLYFQLNILWKHLASVNNCLFGNYSSSSCTLFAMMRQLWKEMKAFSTVGASRIGWVGEFIWSNQSSIMERMVEEW